MPFKNLCRVPVNLIRVKGKDSAALVQSLLTNDVSLLNSMNNSMYGFFLSLSGRVMFDTILYRKESAESPSDSEIWIESHIDETDSLKAHLLKYRMRKKERTYISSLFEIQKTLKTV